MTTATTAGFFVAAVRFLGAGVGTCSISSTKIAGVEPPNALTTEDAVGAAVVFLERGARFAFSFSIFYCISPYPRLG